MPRLLWRALPAALACAVATAALAQDDDTAKQAANGQIALADIAVINVFLELELDNAQAARIGAAVRDTQTRAADLNRQLDNQREAAVADMLTIRDALLNGQSVAAEQVPQWLKLKALEATTAEQVSALWDAAYQTAVRRLTREQQARLVPSVDPRAAADEAANRRLEQQQQLAQQEQLVYQTMAKLMEQARRTPDPRRFRDQAPQAIQAATTNLTRLTPDNPLLQQLNQFVLGRLTQSLKLNPAQYRQAREGIAAELTRATLYVIQQSQGGDTPGAAARTIDPEQLRQALQNPRAAILLDEYAARYRDPLAREPAKTAPAAP